MILGKLGAFCQEEGILLQKYRDRNGRSTADAFQKYQGQVGREKGT